MLSMHRKFQGNSRLPLLSSFIYWCIQFRKHRIWSICLFLLTSLPSKEIRWGRHSIPNMPDKLNFLRTIYWWAVTDRTSYKPVALSDTCVSIGKKKRKHARDRLLLSSGQTQTRGRLLRIPPHAPGMIYFFQPGFGPFSSIFHVWTGVAWSTEGNELNRSDHGRQSA